MTLFHARAIPSQQAKIQLAELTARRRQNAAHPVEQIGTQLRSMMPWISKNKLVDADKN